MPALVGGGARARPGEISLAHCGVLFLDELPEFSAQVLDSLRQPLEDRYVTISRANRHVRYPAKFQLIAAMNPCRCGGGDAAGQCRRGPNCAARYQARISGPLMDRLDLFYDTPAVTALDLTQSGSTESSETVRARVLAARSVQDARSPVDGPTMTNADMPPALLEQVANPDAKGTALLAEAAAKLRLSARSYYRVLRVARTLADLDGTDAVCRLHIAEALSYRHRQTRGVENGEIRLASG